MSPLLRGVEVGLAHGFLLVGPFIKLGPLRNVEGVAEIVGSVNGAAVVLILTACLSIYGAVTFQSEGPQVLTRAWLPAGQQRGWGGAWGWAGQGSDGMRRQHGSKPSAAALQRCRQRQRGDGIG